MEQREADAVFGEVTRKPNNVANHASLGWGSEIACVKRNPYWNGHFLKLHCHGATFEVVRTIRWATFETSTSTQSRGGKVRSSPSDRERHECVDVL
jgi:hypothetical protein